MKKIMPILYCMLIFIIIVFCFYNICYASIESEAQSIENYIIDESQMEPEWLEPREQEKDVSQENKNKSKNRGRRNTITWKISRINVLFTS